MKKTLIIIFSIVSMFAISFYIGMSIDSPNNDDMQEIAQEEKEESKITSSDDEKISPNATLTLKIYYNKCSHTKEETETIPDEIVNMNKNEVEERYQDWKVERFSKDEVVLIKNDEGECGEHYILREENGYILVYSVNESEEENLYMTTNIPVEYLPETDKHALSKGLYVYGEEELNEILQDFE